MKNHNSNGKLKKETQDREANYQIEQENEDSDEEVNFIHSDSDFSKGYNMAEETKEVEDSDLKEKMT